MRRMLSVCSTAFQKSALKTTASDALQLSLLCHELLVLFCLHKAAEHCRWPFQRTMSALDRLMTAASSGVAPSDSSQTTSDPGSKVAKRFSELEKRREKALKDTRGTARWWKFFTVVCTCDKDTDEITAVHLQCSLCDMQLSATNESRIATSHLKNAACSKVKTDPEAAAVVAKAFIKSAESASGQHDPDEQEALAQLQSKKRKASSQSSVADVFLSKEKQQAYTMALYDFFLENSDCVAMQACEHPALK